MDKKTNYWLKNEENNKYLLKRFEELNYLQLLTILSCKICMFCLNCK